MNLIQALASSNSRESTNRIIRWVGKSPVRFGKLVDAAVKGSPMIQVRAAWPLSYCVEEHPSLVKPYLKALVKGLPDKTRHGSYRRSVARLMQYVDIPKSLQGEVATHCFGYIANPQEEPAIRVFAMTVLENLAKVNPDLQGELRLTLEDQLPYAGPAFTSRARKILKRLPRSS